MSESADDECLVRKGFFFSLNQSLKRLDLAPKLVSVPLDPPPVTVKYDGLSGIIIGQLRSTWVNS